MFASSLAIVGFTLIGLGCTLLAFAWAWRRGQFELDDTSASLPFDDQDQRVTRPWETTEQAKDRVDTFGPPVPPAPGEWGGS
ncbi:MAG: hypothetical protein V4850_34070 [Myxococcota bacterium]